VSERREFLEGGLAPLHCDRCGTRVLVKKNSARHTSVQWTSDPAATCPEFAKAVADGAVSALVDTCWTLHETIERAARDGLLEVPGD
jgi:DNA-directed RNA polymerase subunit RPC12/RpoP